MDLDIVIVARFVVLACAVSLLAVGLGVLGWEWRQARGPAVEHEGGVLAAVNYSGILGFVFVGGASAIWIVGTLPDPAEPVNAAVRLVGIVALAAAGLLAAWGLVSIGRDMASAPEVRADTSLVTSGAFAYVRHPLYLSILLLWAGGALALVSWVLALGFVALVPMFVARCRLEERLLVAHFGAAYVAYAARVPMLVPRLTPYRPQPTPHA